MHLPIQVGATLVAKSGVVCDYRRRRKMRVASSPGVPGTWAPGVHANCTHNEIAALCLRSLAPLPHPDDRRPGELFNLAFGRIAAICRRYCGSKWSDLRTAQSYSGSMGRRYLEAERSLRVDGPLRSSDTYLRAFLKAEKLGVGKFGKPRLIYPRSPRYNLRLASWLKPFEHWLWGFLTARRLFGGAPIRVVAKGLSPRQRANLIVRKFNQFKDCVVFEVDGKAFEAHVSTGQLRLEHLCYLAAYHGCRELQGVLSHQLRLVGVTSGGVKFSRSGGRASGDYNTGMGNSLIMLAAVMSGLQGVPYDVLVDGDNALVFLPGAYTSEISGFASRVLDQCGQEMVLERPVDRLEAIRFGQSAPVYLGHRLGWTMTRDYTRVLSGALSSHRWLSEPKYGRRWLNGVARCELSLARGVPVLQAFALQVLRATEDVRPAPAEVYSDYFVVGGWLAERSCVIPVSREARISFELATGLSPEDQIRLENSNLCALGHAERVGEFFTWQALWEADPGSLEPWGDARV